MRKRDGRHGAEAQPIKEIQLEESKKRAKESSALSSSLAPQASDQPPQKCLRGGRRDAGDGGESGNDKDENNKPPNRIGKPVSLDFLSDT
jgi:hypothetical protein